MKVLKEWVKKNKSYCEQLIKDIVLLGKKDHGESKEDRSHQEDRFIDCLQYIKGSLDRLGEIDDLAGKLREVADVMNRFAVLGLGGQPSVRGVLGGINKCLKIKAANVGLEKIKYSLEVLEGIKNRPIASQLEDYKWVTSYYNGIEEILKNFLVKRRKTEPYSDIDSVKAFFESQKVLMMVVAEFLELKDKLNFLFMVGSRF
jgi:hypothetical protein